MAQNRLSKSRILACSVYGENVTTSRRDFLKTTAIAGAGLTIPAIAHASAFAGNGVASPAVAAESGGAAAIAPTRGIGLYPGEPPSRIRAPCSCSIPPLLSQSCAAASGL